MDELIAAVRRLQRANERIAATERTAREISSDRSADDRNEEWAFDAEEWAWDAVARAEYMREDAEQKLLRIAAAVELSD